MVPLHCATQRSPTLRTASGTAALCKVPDWRKKKSSPPTQAHKIGLVYALWEQAGPFLLKKKKKKSLKSIWTISRKNKSSAHRCWRTEGELAWIFIWLNRRDNPSVSLNFHLQSPCILANCHWISVSWQWHWDPKQKKRNLETQPRQGFHLCYLIFHSFEN